MFLNHSTVLYKTLFLANEVLQGCLLHVRGLCESAAGSLTGEGVGSGAVSLVTLDTQTTFTLSDFLQAQQTQNEVALTQLKALRAHAVELVWEACAVSFHILLI